MTARPRSRPRSRVAGLVSRDADHLCKIPTSHAALLAPYPARCWPSQHVRYADLRGRRPRADSSVFGTKYLGPFLPVSGRSPRPNDELAARLRFLPTRPGVPGPMTLPHLRGLKRSHPDARPLRLWPTFAVAHAHDAVERVYSRPAVAAGHDLATKR